jgi:hypothetical protein
VVFLSESVSALLRFGASLLLVIPLAVITQSAEALVLRTHLSGLPRPRRAPTGRTRVAALAGCLAAVVLVLLGGAWTALLGLLAFAPEGVSWLVFAVLALGCAGLPLGHFVLTLRTAREGARASCNSAWFAQHVERKHLWLVLTRAMPVRAWDIVWLTVAVVPSIVDLLATLWAQRPVAGASVDDLVGPATSFAFLVLALAWLAVLVLLDRAQPHLTLARWAVSESARTVKSDKPYRAGPRAAVLLRSCARRRARRLPDSAKEPFLTVCATLAELLRMADLQQYTRAGAGETLRSALQYSARVGCGIDAYDGVQAVGVWLGRHGLEGVPGSLQRQVRLDPAVRLVGTVADVVRNLAYLFVTVTTVVLVVKAGASIGDVVDRFR